MIERLLPGRARAAARTSPWPLVGAVALVIGAWILGNPRSSGPDEGSHEVASAALVRGDRSGTPDPANPGFELFEVPGMVGAPDPGCWALTEDVPVSCADVPLSTETRFAATTSANYPPFGLLLPGLASFVPSARGYAYLARGLSAAVPLALVGASLWLLARRRPSAAAAALLGLTPIAWFTFGIVNPSAYAIAGGLAMWAGILYRHRGAGAADLHADWLAVAGWAALLLTRRDGPFWATWVALAACWVVLERPGVPWQRLGGRARAAVVAAAALGPVTPIVNGERGFNLALAFAPLALVAVDRLAAYGAGLPTRAAQRTLVGYSVVAVLVVAAIATTLRPGGFRAETLRLVVANTGDHLRQLVGILGWLSTPVPLPAVFLFWALVGGLATVAFLESHRTFVIGAVLLGVVVVTAWLLELGQGQNDGQYWQGRYSMPFAVGIPLVLAWRRDTAHVHLVDRLTVPVAVGAWTVSNIAFVAAQQRWAVGINGSWYPWDWDTWASPVWPFLLVVVHLVGSTALLACATSARTGEPV